MKKIKKLAGIVLLLSANTVGADSLPQDQQKITQAMASVARGDIESLKGQASSMLDKTSADWVRNMLATENGTTEVSVTGITGAAAIWDVLLVRPISENSSENTFVQGSLLRQNDRTTINLGYGYRKLLSHDRVLVGTNLFYDHEFPYDHQRMSIGGEIRTTIGELNANVYQGISNWKGADSGFEEKALGGYDGEIAIALPYLPSTQARIKRFVWNGIEGADDLKGTTYSITGLISPSLSIEAGYSDYNNINGEHFLRLTYSIRDEKQHNYHKPIRLDVPYSLDSMANKKYEKVRRENRIVKATRRTGFSLTAVAY